MRFGAGHHKYPPRKARIVSLRPMLEDLNDLRLRGFPRMSETPETTATSSETGITVAMITMNEEKAVGKVIGDIQRAVPGAEILVVDSSRDRTAELAQAM